MSDQRQRAIDGLEVGDRFELTRTFSESDTRAFGQLTRDYNPVHYEPRFAAEKGFPGLICHGLLVGGMICELGGQLAWLATDMRFRFLRPVYFGDSVTCTLTITALGERGHGEAEAEFVDQRGQLVATASLAGRAPVGGSREVLAQMIAEGDPTNPLRSN